MYVHSLAHLRAQDVGAVLSFDTSQIGSPPLRRLTVQFSDAMYVVSTTRSNVFIAKRAIAAAGPGDGAAAAASSTGPA